MFKALIKASCAAAAIVASSCTTQPTVTPATMVLTNGKIVTVAETPAEAQAVAGA